VGFARFVSDHARTLTDRAGAAGQRPAHTKEIANLVVTTLGASPSQAVTLAVTQRIADTARVALVSRPNLKASAADSASVNDIMRALTSAVTQVDRAIKTVAVARRAR